ncbi:S49 family peptidase [Actinophytocola algeriensis]|uniref:Signal peptide peptidase SppA n=1 Tax=Actinophytocola algeriensis TaxID=1768010 RepID=A0A7W7Q4Y7_9PSEU|nr:S49 family peptidase [Actinophytocola algeriensis]MBB4906806.1 signal peptide peptidase SppA [Actinophytocola algeriensis]MBE1478287.1 signal peptide peptidase SppA [Actinophytocola algeriensis]
MSVTEKLAARLPINRGTAKPVVAVVKLHGVITPTPSPLSRGTININTVEQALAKAFDHERLSAVALAINSPGGAPTQSALVSERIRELADKKKVPVLAFCEDVAASGGYWLACAADEIFAHSSSLVGSIGVVTAGFGLNGLLERVGVERRVYTAGAHKVRLDPFRPEKDEDVEWIKGLQSQLHDQFVSWVKDRRGDRLNDGEDLFTGEVWTGVRAKEMGLVDGVGNLRAVLTSRFPEAELVVAEPKRPLLARLGLGGATQSLLTAIEHRALWSRFGL